MQLVASTQIARQLVPVGFRLFVFVLDSSSVFCLCRTDGCLHDCLCLCGAGPFRPGSEFYFDRFNTPHSPLQEFGNIERMATSVLLRERHMINRAKSARLLGQTSRQSSRNGKVGCTATV